MNENTSQTPVAPQPEVQKSSRNTLLTLISLLVLTGIIGTTLFLYIQNRQTPTAKQKNIPQKTAQQNTKEAIAPTVALRPLTTEEGKKALEKFKQTCKDFTSLDEALKTPELACILDLSGKGLSLLPSEITKLTKLQMINLSNNNFAQFPSQLLEIPKLGAINLANNKLTITPDVSKLTALQLLILKGNPVANKITPSPKQALSTTTTPKNPPELKIIY